MHYSTLALLASAGYVSAGTYAVNHFYGTGPLMMGRVDPIISPGSPSQHVHAVQGGSAFAETMTNEQPMTSNCTSSLIKNDLSNYWTPALYFQDPTTKLLEPVPMFYMNVYYFFDTTDDEIVAFPQGLRMIVGNPNLRTPPAGGAELVYDLSNGTPQPIDWVCPRTSTSTPLYPADSTGVDGVGIQDPTNTGAGVGFPDQNCDGYASPLRANIHFPSCYNPAVGLDDYENNMEWPTNGNCPTGYTHVPHLFYEVYWNTPLFADRWTQGQGTQPFVLAQGDPTGYGLHADFIAGWDIPTLQAIIDTCDAGDSGMDKCPTVIGGVNDPSDSCNIPDPVNEVLTGTMSLLPGSLTVGVWGTNAASAAVAPTGAAATGSSMAAKTTAAMAAGSSAAKQTASNAIQVIQTQAAAAPAPTTMVTQVASVSTGIVDGQGSTITNYVSETTVKWVTVTPSAAAPSGSSSSSTISGGSDVAGWTYKGCFQDTTSRVMTGITLANVGQGEVDNTDCTSYCDTRGYSMAGTEYGGQCFCADSLTTTMPLAESECDMPCQGDSLQTCGGGMALSVYEKGSSSKKRSRHLHRHILEAKN